MNQSSLVTPTILITGLITLLVTLIGDTVTAATDWHMVWLSGASLLVGLEAIALRSRMVAGLHETQGGAVRYLAVEVFGLIALARIVATLGQGSNGWAAMTTWITDPLAAFDAPFLFCLLTLLTVAVLSRSGIAAIAALTPNSPLKTPLQSLDMLFYRSDAIARRQAAVSALSRAVGWGGLLMIVTLGVQYRQHTFPLSATGWMALYLAGGLSLITLAQRRALLADWQSDEADIAPEVNRRWQWLSMSTIGLVLVLALALPVQVAPLVPDDWQETLLLIGGIVLLCAMILSLLFIGMLSLVALLPLILLMILSSLMNTSANAVTSIVPPILPPSVESTPPVWPGLIFWVCIALLTGLAFWTIVRRQQWVKQGWPQLYEWITAARQQIKQRRRDRRWRLSFGRRPTASPDPIRSPVDIAITCYHAALRYAANQGYPRQPAQTPAEFAEHTVPQLAEAGEELRALTLAYHRAAYAGHASDPVERQQVRTLLRRFRQKIMQRRRVRKI
ncbi:DUF4129 domain-containing protein [Chloroflexus sp.]|uniref:DUF4129 domain-containing protein n=1 Tax=Chloroflexus sp. TaxID=1904827 RepID=UPI00258FE37B|nr:DUF4129 domain-containing protein [Chloroflexus sp.]